MSMESPVLHFGLGVNDVKNGLILWPKYAHDFFKLFYISFAWAFDLYLGDEVNA